ncbi:MAG: 3-methyl-2-oxobutanoate hydroxymethyltransferase [Pseudomonadota bacterium]
MTQKTVPQLTAMKGRERIAALTAYDFQIASMLDEIGIDILLVGDSVGNVVYGLPTTIGVTVEDILRHTSAVARAAKRALVVADMPFGSYQPSVEVAVTNAARFLAEGGAQAVKLEGGRPMEETIRRLVDVGIPVMGHVGLTPQSYHQIGGYRMRGKSTTEAEAIHQDALAVERAGAFSIVLECVEPTLATEITRALKIPTIGIGSGNGCDGEVLVTNDLLGLTVSFVPKFVEPLVNLRTTISEAARTYVTKVKENRK